MARANRPKSAEGWVDTKISNVRIGKCKYVYDRTVMPRKEWENLKRSLLEAEPYHDLTEHKKARGILIVSETLILVI